MSRLQHIHRILGLAAASALLSGCILIDGAPKQPVTIDPEVGRTGAAAAYSYSYQPTGGTPDRVVRRTSNAGWFYYPDTLAGIPDGYAVFLNSTEGYLLRAVSPSAAGELMVVDNGAQFTRIGTSEIPTTGQAHYSGGYAALLVDGARDLAPGAISGEAELDVNFALQNVKGKVFNRLLDGATVMDDVALARTALSDGAFSGSATGGATASGSYAGVIVGADGSEAIGGVTLTHTGATAGTEQGGFVVTQ